MAKQDIPSERHPSYGLVSVSRVSCGPPGRILFESPFRHHNYVTLSIQRASRSRHHLHGNHVMGEGEIVEIAMSEVQYAAMLTSLNYGQGVPCTIQRVGGKLVEEPPADRTQEKFRQESQGHYEELARMAEELEGLTRLKASEIKQPQRERMNFLALKIQQGLTCNREFFIKQFTEEMSRVTTAAKAEIQAHLLSVTQRAGVEALKGQSGPIGLPAGMSDPVTPKE